MAIWNLCRMGFCVETGMAKRRITGQVIVDIIIWLIVGIPVIYLFLAGVPAHRGFFCGDTSISYPYRPGTIGTKMLLVLGLSASVVVVILVELLNGLSRKCYKSPASSHGVGHIIKCYAVFMFGFSINTVFVEAIKNVTGTLRPNFIDVCRPRFNTSRCPGYITDYECTGATAEAIRISRQSFPSGHSAFTMYIAVYFCMYIHHRLQIKFSRVFKLVLQTSLLLTSSVCGFRRITDNKHHLNDVIAGFFLGAVVALLVYKALAERLMTSSDDHELMACKDEEQSETCCTYQTNGIDPVTPTPLLSLEYNNGIENGYSGRHPLELNLKTSVSNPALSSAEI